MLDAADWSPQNTRPHRTGSTTAVVAWRRGQALTRADFAAQVAAWRGVLAAQPGVRWALHVEDTFDFATALFGAWHAGKTVILPGDMQEDTVARLRGVADGLLGDLPGALPRPRPAAAGDIGDWPALDAQATALVVYTSGTSGEPLAIPKRLAQLEAEVRVLEARFGATCARPASRRRAWRPRRSRRARRARRAGRRRRRRVLRRVHRAAHDLGHRHAPAHLRSVVPRPLAAGRRTPVRQRAAGLQRGDRAEGHGPRGARREPGASASPARDARLVGGACRPACRVLLRRPVAAGSRRQHAGAAGHGARRGVRQLRNRRRRLAPARTPWRDVAAVARRRGAHRRW